MTTVSIVLPTYNGQKYLRESIESCLAQTFKDFELIIVNDCSKDATPQIADEFAARDPRIKVIHLNPNRKLPGALNAGFAAATGKYLTWTSDDNKYAPTAIARMVEFLDTHPDIGLVYFNYRNLSANGEILDVGDFGPPENLAFFGVVGACFMYRSTVRDAVGDYDESLFCAEDYDYWLRVASQFKLAWVPEVEYYYRRHDGSLTSTQYQKMVRSMRGSLVKSLHKLDVPRKNRSRGHLVIASVSYRDRQLADALKHLALASFYSPFTVLGRIFGGLSSRGTAVFNRDFADAVPKNYNPPEPSPRK